MSEARRLLVVGVPRSGTTWVARALSHAGIGWVNEPDNFHRDPCAAIALRAAGRYPVLAAGDAAPAAYATLWDLAFRGGWPHDPATRLLRRAGMRLPGWPRRALIGTAARALALRPAPREGVMVKTVLGIFALDWIVARHRPTVVVVRSRPLNAVSSWVTLGWTGERWFPAWVAQHRPALAAAVAGDVTGPVARTAFQVGVLAYGLEEAVRRHPDWIVVDHEDLCAAPEAGFAGLLDRVGLPWTDGVAAFLAGSNRAGTGMETNRISGEQPERWRRLSAAQLAEAAEVLAALPPASAPAADGRILPEAATG